MSKHDLLNYVSSRADVAALDVAEAFDISEAAAGMALLRALRQQLVCRSPSPDQRAYWYGISARGRVRLAYLRRCDA